MAEKLLIELPVLLPEVPDEQDACVRRLIERLESESGIERVHVRPASSDAPATLCIHYNPASLSLSRIRQTAARLGAELTDRYGHLVLDAHRSRHPRHARALAERLRSSPGVVEAEVAASGALVIEFDRGKTDEASLRQAAHEPAIADGPLDPDHGHDHEHEHGGIFGERTEIVFTGLAGVSLALGFGLSFVVGVPDWLPLGMYVGAYVFGGYPMLREAFASIRAGRFDVELLMLVAAAGAAFLGEWLEGGFLLFLFSLGHSLERYAMGRARGAIAALAELAPETALVRRGDDEQVVPVEELVIGDRVVVRTNERIPADGFVVQGTGAVNQAPITGESVPADKRPVDDPATALADWTRLDPDRRVFAGTINGSAALEIVVCRLSAESTLARVVRLVSEGGTRQAPSQRFADRFERIFVPSVLGLATLLLLAGLVLDESFSASFYRAMAVLVAASPCALAIATPSAVISGVARAARGGVLVKGGGPLENLGTLTAIAFDKTGTLTEGRPRVTDIVPAEGVADTELLKTAFAVERLSDHPLAVAVAGFVQEKFAGQPLEVAHDVESLDGRGVRARLGADDAWVGRDRLFTELDGRPLEPAISEAVAALEKNGRTTMIVRLGARYLGVIGLMDTPRSAAADTIRRLRGLGIRRMIMLSGDNQGVADAVAREVGLDEARGGLLPEDKVETIRSFAAREKVAMVGDGVNDAPAMANATVGIAMGAAGSDVALETADVALMADDLRHLTFAVGLSRQTSRIIRQNLWMSLGMVAFLIPATVLGLHIGPAVVLHEGSTLVVVFNALRLLAYRER